MFLFLYKSLRMVFSAIRGSDSPKQIGFGIALGMLIGLLPKDSLFTYVFGLFVFATSVNLLSTSISAIAFTWLGIFLDPVSHQIGYFVLTYPELQSTWVWFYQLPIVPWTRFNNTIVMGSLLIGLLSCFPVYYGSTLYFKNYGPRISRQLLRFWIYRILVGKKKLSQLAGASE